MATDPMAQAIDDARALLDTLVASDWHDVHVVAGETEIFIAKASGRANPLLVAHEPAVAEVSSPQAVTQEEVRAPHVATLVMVLPVGTEVAAGDRVAVLRVLDDEQPLAATVAGTVSACPAATGDLLNYGAPVLLLEIAA